MERIKGKLVELKGKLAELRKLAWAMKDLSKNKQRLVWQGEFLQEALKGKDNITT